VVETPARWGAVLDKLGKSRRENLKRKEALKNNRNCQDLKGGVRDGFAVLGIRSGEQKKEYERV